MNVCESECMSPVYSIAKSKIQIGRIIDKKTFKTEERYIKRVQSICSSVMPVYGMSMTEACHEQGRDISFTHKK